MIPEKHRFSLLTYFCGTFLLVSYFRAIQVSFEDGSGLISVLSVTLLVLVPSLFILWSEYRGRVHGQQLAGFYFGFCGFFFFLETVFDGMEGPVKFTDFQILLMKILAGLMMLSMCLCLYRDFQWRSPKKSSPA